jgi:gliding motility-associated-like protein
VTVNNVNDAPVITSSPITSINEDVAYSYTITASDVDNDPLQFSLTQTPTWLSLTNNGNGTATLTGTPTNSNVGGNSVTVRVSDGTVSVDQAFTVTVINVNDAPIVTGTTSTIATNEDIPITLSLNNFNVTDADNNTYPSGFSLIVNTGTNYTVSGNTVTPNANFNGTLIVPIQVNDNQSTNNLSNIFNLSLTVNAVNDNPVAQNITITTKENVAANISILSSISDVDNNISLNSLSVSQLPTHGNTSVDKVNGVITYTPTTGFTGNDTFQYTICDAQNACTTATISITISNEAPTAINDVANLNEDGTITIDVLSNDTDPQNNILPSSLIITNQPTHGTVVINNNRTTTYTPTVNYNGSDSFGYQICDATSYCATATVTITINAVNDAPTLTSDAASTPEDTPILVNVLANDNDSKDLGSSINTTSLTITSQPTHGTAIVQSGQIYYSPATNYFGTDILTYSVSDNGLPLPALTGSTTLSFTITSVNDKPVISGTTSSLSTNEDTPITVLLTQLTVTDADNTYPTDFTLSIAAGSHYSVTGNFITPELNYSGTLSIPVTVNDGSDDSNTYNLLMTVIPINDAPVITGTTAAISTSEDTPISLQLSNLSVTDIDNNYPSAFSLTVNPGSHYTVSNGSTITPELNYNGSLSVPVFVNDGTANSNIYNVPISVTAVNDAPTFTSTPVTSVQQGSAYSYTTTASDVDNATLTITAISKPAWLTLSATVNNQATLSGATTQAQVGSHQVTLRVSDGTNTADQTFTITVINVNDAPVITSSPITTINEDAAYNYTITATDADNDALSFTLTQAPTWLSLTDNGDGTALLSGTPTNNNVGDHNISITVSDNILSAQQTFIITVNNVNDAPVINSANTTFNTNEDAPIILSTNNLNISDIDNPDLTGFTLIVNNGSNYTVLGNTVTPNANFNETLTVPVQVNDNQSINNLSNIYNLSITVHSVNDAPVLSAIEPGTLSFTENAEPLTITQSLAMTDVDNTNLQNATISIDGFVAGEDVLTFTPIEGITDVWNNSTGILTFSGSAPLANYTTLLQSIQYQNITDNPTTTLRQIQFTVSDGSMPSNVVSRSIAITAINDVPVALDIFTSTKENTAKAISILSSVSDAENEISLNSLTIGTLPQHGTTSIDEINGIITYTPATDFSGSDSFQYTICDTQDACATATISIVVSNETPNALDDNATVTEDETVTIPVLNNDTDTQNNIIPSSLTITRQPLHGEVAINDDFAVVYKPNANYNGSDNFGYQICDATSHCATANVSITINAVNDVPVLTDDSAITLEDTPILVNILANDNDAKDAGSSINASSLNITTQPLHGTAVIQNGQIYYTPAANYFGTDILTYSVSDNGLPLPALTASAILNISVTSVNDKPQITGQQSVSTNEDTPFALNINQLSITDIDNSQTDFTISVSAGTNYTINNTTITPSANYNGTLTIPIQVSDGQSLSDIFNLSVTVNAVNDKPVALNETFYTAESTPINLNVLANDNDQNDPQGGIDASSLTIIRHPAHGSAIILPNFTINYSPNSAYWGNDTIVYRIQDKGYPMPALADTAMVVIEISRLSPQANNDNATVNEDQSVVINLLANDTDSGDNIAPTTVQIITQPAHGTLSGLQGGSVTYLPASNYNGSDSFTYRVKDVTNLISNTATVTISVLPVNDAPVALDKTFVTEPNKSLILTLLQIASDIDSELDINSLIINTQAQHGNATIDVNKEEIIYIPQTNYTGEDHFSFHVSDLEGLPSNVATITIQISDQWPHVVNDQTSTLEDTPTTVNVALNDTDPQNNINPLSVTITIPPKNGTASIETTTGFIVYNPAANFAGSDSLQYTICDTDNYCSEGWLKIIVNAVNDAPICQNDQLTTNEDEANSIDVTTNDADPENGLNKASLTFIAQPVNGTASIDNNQLINYIPTVNFNGTDSLKYQICDVDNLCATAILYINVNAVNDAPVAQNDSYNAYTSQPTVIEVLSNDTDIDNNLDASLTKVTTLPTHGNAIVNTNGTITYTSNDGFTGSDSFIYSITDSGGLTASATVLLTIQTGNIVPTAVNDYTQTNEDQSIDINPLTNDFDPNNNLNNESLAITMLPKHGTASIGTQQRITYTPEVNYNGNDTIVYQICDTGMPSSLCATAQIIISVAAINDAPIAQNDDIETVDGAKIVVDILGNDSDADNDALTPTLINDVPDARYQASINSNGELDITTTAGSYCYVATINYTISDGNGGYSTAAIEISVSPADNDQDGIPNAVEGLEIDSDNDLTPNYLDTDSDNDNIPDITESQISDACTDEPVDTDNDGTPDYLDSDSDNDGVADIAEGIDDCDNDSTANYIDAIDDCPDRVLVAKTFSPNGDGINDYFVIPIISEYPQNELSVYNRWGAQVYTKVNYDNSWDGRSSSSTLNSDILPEGTYFYVLKLGNDNRVLKGFIYIKR